MIIKDKDLLKKIIKELRKNNLKIVFTNGCFDIVHKGHLYILREAKKLGDVLIVGLNSDSSIKKLKGKKRPIINLDSRILLLDSLKFVDFVMPFDELTPINLIKIIKPDIHVKGGDYNINDLPEKNIVEKYGGIIKIIPAIKDYSTTNIIDKILLNK